MEPRAALGHWDAATGRGTLWAGSGGAVRQKTELAEVLGVGESWVARFLKFGKPSRSFNCYARTAKAKRAA